MDIDVGVDLVAEDRIRALLAQPDIERTVFTAGELRACAGRRDRYARLAGRFAAKEALLKALGTGLGPGMRWTDVEVVNERSGRPAVRLHGAVARAWAAAGGGTPALSISHTGGFAIAHVVVARPGIAEPKEAACSSI
ncbi:holo-ACP synthase [Actinomycetes bacterium KLBMP 9797]